MFRETMNALMLCFIIVYILKFKVIYSTIPIPCGEPGVPNNGYTNFSLNQSLLSNTSSNHYISGTIVEYYCNSSSILFGNQKRQCYRSGKWDNKVPQCLQLLNAELFLNYLNSQNIIKAIDGDLKTCFISKSSNQETSHSWEISLKEKILIKAIRLSFIRETYSNIYADYTLWIKSKNDGTQYEIAKSKKFTAYNNKIYAYFHNCSGIIQADVLRIDSENKFTLCEVEVYSLSNNNELRCGIPDRPSNGFVRTQLRNNELFANFQCNDNYVLTGVQSTKCDSNGLWSALTPLCLNENSQTRTRSRKWSKTTVGITTTLTTKLSSEPITCPRLEEENGIFSFTNGLNFGSRATLKCNEGFRLSSQYQSYECMSNGVWSDFNSLNCNRIECPIIKKIPNAKIVHNFVEGKAFYLSEMEIHCVNSKVENRFCDQNGSWVQKSDLQNHKAITDLHNLCKTNPKLNSSKSHDNNQIKSLDMNTLIIVSVIAAITTTIIIFVLMSFILLLKSKFKTSHSNIHTNNETVMPPVKDFSYIEIKHNFANRRRFSELSHIYNTPIFENDEEIETCFSSSVAFGSRGKTSIIHTYSEPFDFQINGSHNISESNNENIYSEPYVSAENEIYSEFT